MTELKQTPATDLLAMFDPKVHGAIIDRAKKPGTEAIVVFENLQMDSSRLGMRTAVPIGEPWTWKKLSDVVGRWLYDLPSQRQYPVAYAKADDFK